MIVTVQQHILQDQKRFPGASGEFSWLLSGITLATKMVQARVRRAGLTDILVRRPTGELGNRPRSDCWVAKRSGPAPQKRRHQFNAGTTTRRGSSPGHEILTMEG